MHADNIFVNYIITYNLFDTKSTKTESFTTYVKVCPPRYSFLISELAGEQRFASVVARRLECMGALTHGDRRSGEKQQDLSRFNFDTALGKKALDLCLKTIR